MKMTTLFNHSISPSFVFEVCNFFLGGYLGMQDWDGLKEIFLKLFFLQIFIYFITGTNNDENIEIVPIKRIEMENSPRNGVIYQP